MAGHETRQGEKKNYDKQGRRTTELPTTIIVWSRSVLTGRIVEKQINDPRLGLYFLGRYLIVVKWWCAPPNGWIGGRRGGNQGTQNGPNRANV